MGSLLQPAHRTTSHPYNTYSNQQSKCVTTKLPLLLLTTAPACARLDSPEMTLPEPCSPPLLGDPGTRVSWSAWDRRTPTSETRPRPRGGRWPRSCSRPSTPRPCTSPSRLCSPCTPLAVPPVSCLTPATVSPTPSPSMRDTPFPTPSSGLTLLAVTSPTIS